MLYIRVESGDVLNALDVLIRRVQDMEPVMDAIGQELESRVSGRFETETDPSGHPWAPWAESTRQSYPRDGNHRILDRYGDLLGSLNHQAARDRVVVGFGAPHAVFHELSTRNMVRRGMLLDDPAAGTLGEGDEESVLALLNRYFSARP